MNETFPQRYFCDESAGSGAASRAVTTVVWSEGMYRWSMWACEDRGVTGEA